jgi:hypothetical protein
MRRVAPPEHQVKEVAFGRLQGFEDKEMEKFQAGQVITVEIRNLVRSLLPSGFALTTRNGWPHAT